MVRHPLITTLEEEFNRDRDCDCECDKDYYKIYSKEINYKKKIILK